MSKQEDKKIKIHNKSDIPDNIIIKRNELVEQCLEVEKKLPFFLYDYFIYLKNAVQITTRLAYLQDVLFFCKYMVNETRLTQADSPKEITIEEFTKITSRDVNRFIGEYCTRYIIESENATYIMENHNRSLARKRSSLSILFKFLYREELMEKNISDGFNPIRLPKPQPDAIKKLEIEEVNRLLHIVETGEGLSNKEHDYWLKTKYRDKAILVLFITYGLRISELQQLNMGSFSSTRKAFKIYRKRGKEVEMPINKSAAKVINDYIQLERSKTSTTEDTPLFLSLQGTRITERAIRELVKKYTALSMKTSRRNGYSPHKLRATAASSLIEYGFSIYDVQNLLDHDNVTTTQLYASHRKNVKKDVISQYEIIPEDEE